MFSNVYEPLLIGLLFWVLLFYKLCIVFFSFKILKLGAIRKAFSFYSLSGFIFQTPCVASHLKGRRTGCCVSRILREASAPGERGPASLARPDNSGTRTSQTRVSTQLKPLRQLVRSGQEPKQGVRGPTSSVLCQASIGSGVFPGPGPPAAPGEDAEWGKGMTRAPHPHTLHPLRPLAQGYAGGEPPPPFVRRWLAGGRCRF